MEAYAPQFLCNNIIPSLIKSSVDNYDPGQFNQSAFLFRSGFL